MNQPNNPLSAMKALIVDDEEGARDILERLLMKVPDVEIIGKASSADEALELILSGKPDIIFLDIQMPEKSGFDLIDYLNRYLLQTHVVFVTAHAEHAIHALKVAAFDYLLKPVMLSELRDTVLRFRASQQQAGNRKPMTPAPSHQQKIKFNTRTGYLLVNPEDILYCEADVNYTVFYFGKGSREVVTLNLGRIEELLASYPFYRISRSMLINRNHLSKADRQKKQCVLVKEGEAVILEISPGHLRELEKFLDSPSPE